jgi:hypothetical protein
VREASWTVARHQLGEAAFEAARTEGRLVARQAAVHLALELP